MSAAHKLPQTNKKQEADLFDDHGDHDELISHVKKGEEGEGPWLVSYADLMTLLMGFFALLSSMSTPDKKQYAMLRQAAVAAFGGTLEKPYEPLSQEIKKFIEENKLDDQVQVVTSMDGVTLTFTGTLFFDSGDFKVKDSAASLMERLAQVIKNNPNDYRAMIEGHTDSVPIRHPIIGSNWELSGIRASRVAQIFETNGFAKDHLIIIGWGENKPIFPERTPQGELIQENLAKNRRIVIHVYDRKYSDDPVRDHESSKDEKPSSQEHSSMGGQGPPSALIRQHQRNKNSRPSEAQGQVSQDNAGLAHKVETPASNKN